jgi:hypothetical protein
MIINQDWKYEDAGTLDKTHLRFFTKKSIIRMFESCGYKINKIEGINAGSFGISYKVSKLLFRKKMKDTKFLQFAVVASK